MSEKWYGKVVMFTPGGPIVTMPLGDLMARNDAEIERHREEIERLREEMQGAKADAWDEGYQDHQEMIDGIARKPSNPYR